MSESDKKAIIAVTIIVLGLCGLYIHIDYSGWVLLVGLLIAIG